MKVTSTPIVASDVIAFRVSGESLWINNVEYDLSVVADGEARWSSWLQCPWIVGYVRREGGEIEVSLLQPVAPEALAPPRSFSVVDGWPT